MKLFILGALFLSMLSGCDIATAETISESMLVKCTLGEYESGSLIEMTATAEGIRNRYKALGSYRGVYGCKAVKEVLGVFYRGNRAIPIYAVKRAKRAVIDSKGSNYTLGAYHWEAVEIFGKPKWAYSMAKTAKVGNHTFYK